VAAERDVVGVVPAAGRATRISPLPCSKEIYPVGFRSGLETGAVRPKAACTYLLERMCFASITKVYVVLRDGKWDIPAYLRGGEQLGIELAYLIADLPFGAPYTVGRAVPFVRNATVAFGFPDMIYRSEDIFARLLERQAVRPADILLGLFPVEAGRQVDILDVQDDGRVRQVVVQPPDARLRSTWGVAVWTPSFSEFIDAYVRDHAATAAAEPEPSMGSVIQQAIEAGLRVEAIRVCDTPYVDIGTPEGLLEAHRRAIRCDEHGRNEHTT